MGPPLLASLAYSWLSPGSRHFLPVSELLVMPSRAGHLGNEGMKSQTQQTSSTLAELGAVFRKWPDMGLECLFRAAIFFIYVPPLVPHPTRT